MSIKQVQQLIADLPFLQQEIEVVAGKTVYSSDSLSVCLVGAFSTGKSSLINMLLGEILLPTAREESTALPTFIEYADGMEMALLDTEGSRSVITQAEFAQYTVQAPENALCSQLSYCADWLRGLTLIDLPGLGSTSERHREYTQAQISAADVVIYLLSSRGITQDDLVLLKSIKQHRKSVKVVVGHWDQIEESMSEGEQGPNLIEWSTTILKESGLDLDLLGVSKHGHGREEVIQFLQASSLQVEQIRQQRFVAELVPVLRGELSELELRKKVARAQSDVEKKQLQSDLMEQRGALLALKQRLYDEGNADQSRLKQLAEQSVAQHQAALAEQLKALPALESEVEWDQFIESAYQAVQVQIQSLAVSLEAFSSDYGSMELHRDEVKKCDVHLPEPEKIEVDHFIDAGRLASLQSELDKAKTSLESDKQKIEALSGVNVDASHQELLELRKEQGEVAQQKLPRIVREIEGSQAGSMLGKTVGQLLDVGLIVVAPMFAASKGAALVSTGSKVLQTAKTTDKVAKMVNSPGMEPVMKFTEKLSLSYWGEQIGRGFDQAPRTEEVVDPEARAEQQRVLQQCNQKISAQKRELSRLEALQQQREYSEWALEQNLKDQQRLEEGIKGLQQEAQEAELDAKRDVESQKKRLWLNYRQQVVTHNINTLAQQARSMTALLSKTCKGYWKDKVEDSLKNNVDTIDALSKKIGASPDKKKVELDFLQDQVMKVEAVLVEIR